MCNYNTSQEALYNTSQDALYYTQHNFFERAMDLYNTQFSNNFRYF